MDKVISPSNINGIIKAPASKSFMLRAIALSILSKTETCILNPSYCNDALVGLNIARSFGCGVIESENQIIIKPKVNNFSSVLNCGESGLAIRLFTPIVALQQRQVTLNAKGSLLNRPVGFMVSTLNQLGVNITTNNGFPPITISGTIRSEQATVDGALSSQFLSGLLIALPLAKVNTTLIVKNLKSIPYIKMTLKAIELFGGKINHHFNYSEFNIEGGQSYSADKYFIEGDWSGAATLLVAGAMVGSITVESLSTESTQADIQVLQALKQAGAIVKTKVNSVSIETPKKLKAFTFDALHCPDLFPALTALAAVCKGVSCISGVHRLKHKESNRGEVLQKEFSKLGIKIWFENDNMFIEGGKIKSATVFAHNDHRIAMAMTLAGLKANSPITITGTECVNKTYPNFFNDMIDLGAKIE